MAQISTIGVGQDYTSIALWAATEGAADYGVGNPAIGEISGTLSESVAITGVFVRGYILRAKAGEEFDPITLAGAGITGQLRPNASTAIQTIIRDLVLAGGVEYLNDELAEINDCLVEAVGITAVNALASPCIATNVLTRNCDRAFEANTGNTNVTATNCGSLGVTGTFSFVRFLTTNCFHTGSGSGYAATLAGSDYNASSDTTAPGANSLQNRTTADYVDFAGNDFRTALSSALATAGDGGTYIGFALESGAGTPPTGTTTVDSVTPTTITASVAYSYDAADETGYKYRLDGGSLVDIGTTNPFVISGLTENTAYTVEVLAYNGDGDGTLSTPATNFTTDAAVVPSITTEPLKNNTGQLLANETGVIADVYDTTSGALVVRKTGLTSDAQGVVTFTDALMSAATVYRVVITLSGNEEGIARITSA